MFTQEIADAMNHYLLAVQSAMQIPCPSLAGVYSRCAARIALNELQHDVDFMEVE